MSWIELDDVILDHPKFIRAAREAGGDAIFLWLGLRAYCSQKLSDGFIPEDMVDDVRGPKSIKSRERCMRVALFKLMSAIREVEKQDEPPRSNVVPFRARRRSQ